MQRRIPYAAATTVQAAVIPALPTAVRCGSRWLASNSSKAAARTSTPQINLGLAAPQMAPLERSQPILDLLGTVAVNSGAAALRRTRTAERDETAIHEAQTEGTAAPPPPISSVPMLDADGLPLQHNDATTVLLIGWLGSKKHHLDKYAQMHRAAGRRVITYRPQAFGMIQPERWELPKTQECIQQLCDEVEQGRSLVVHALSNLGAFQLALMLHELEVASARGANTSDMRPERTRMLLRTGLRAIIFDSAPAPLSPQVIMRGYVGYLASAGLPGWDRLTALMGRKTSAHPHVQYDLTGWKRRLMERCIQSLLRMPSFRRHLHHLHVSLRTLIPASTNLLYLYSTADELIPAADILAHADSQAALSQRAEDEEEQHVSSSTASSPSPLVPLLLHPLSSHPLSDLERGELSFQSRIHWLPCKEKRREVAKRNERQAREAILTVEQLRVENARIHVEQQQQPIAPAMKQGSEDTVSSQPSSRFPLAEDDPSPLLSTFRSHLLRIFSAANKGCIVVVVGGGGGGASNDDASISNPTRAPFDVMHGTESAQRAAQAAAQGIRLLRTVTTVQFHASPHVQHYRCYPRTYTAFIDAWLANHAAPTMMQCPPENLQAVRQAMLAEEPHSDAAKPTQQNAQQASPNK